MHLDSSNFNQSDRSWSVYWHSSSFREALKAGNTSVRVIIVSNPFDSPNT